MATAVLALMASNCRDRESTNAPPAQPRDRLTFTELMHDGYRGTAPLDNRYFMPLGKWEAAGHELEGTLTVPEIVMHKSGEAADSAGPQDYFPGLPYRK